MVRNICLIVFLLMLASCTSTQVRPVDRCVGLQHVCIQENPKVIVGDFLIVLREGFERHGISTQVSSGRVPEECEYILTYTALQSWDFYPYLSYAALWLEHKGRRIGSAEYRLIGKGGLSLMKWQGTKTKMEPVIDELLKAY